MLNDHNKTTSNHLLKNMKFLLVFTPINKATKKETAQVSRWARIFQETRTVYISASKLLANLWLIWLEIKCSAQRAHKPVNTSSEKQKTCTKTQVVCCLIFLWHSCFSKEICFDFFPEMTKRLFPQFYCEWWLQTP